MKTVADKLLVRPLPAETRTRGGIFIPDSAQKHGVFADVVAVGPGRTLPGGARRPIEVAPGQRIAMHPDAGYPVDFDGEQLLSIYEADVLGVCEAEVPQ